MTKTTNLKSIPINIRCISSIQEFENLRDNWKRLLDQNHIQSAFLSWEWLFSWWKTFGHDKSLRIIAAWKSDRLVGIAPLMLEKRKKFGLNIRSPMHTWNTDE